MEKNEKKEEEFPDVTELLNLVGVPQREMESLIGKLHPPLTKKPEEILTIARLDREWEAMLLLFMPYKKYWKDEFIDFGMFIAELESIARGGLGRNEILMGARALTHQEAPEVGTSTPMESEESEEGEGKKYRPRFGRKKK